MERRLRPLLIAAALALAALALPRPGWTAAYESLVEQGSFYLERGATYGADAVRALEKAEQESPERAGTDPKFLAALARAYALTSRFTEAYWVLDRWERLGALAPVGEALRARLLSESGLGRLRLSSAVPVGRITARLVPEEEERIEVTARKALDRLGELLARGLELTDGGVTLLVPEGRYAIACDGPLLYAPRDPTSVEVWAGDEGAVRLVAAAPDPAGWTISAGNRTVSLSWPPIAGAAYELAREQGQGERSTVYRGAEPTFQDAGLPVGARVRYVLKTYGPQGDLIAVSSAEAQTMPPVSRLAAEARLGADLRVTVSWTLGQGAADRVRVVRKGPRSEDVVADVQERDAILKGSVTDGPFTPAAEKLGLTYRVEAWVAEAEAASAEAEAPAEVPPLVERVTSVTQGVERGAVVLQWDTLPREGVAQGYAVFRQRGEGIVGELVGRVEDPFAREFEYAVEDPLKASEWRHFVVPYLGDRYLLDPEDVSFGGQVPEETLERRAARGRRPPNLALAWDAAPGAAGYAVKVGEGKEVFVKRPYLEITGLQSALMATTHEVKIYALDVEGRKKGLVTVQIQYEHYPRVGPKEEEP